MPARLIGPRRMGGAFYKKRPSARKPRVKLSKTASKAVKKAVKTALRKESETKFVSVKQDLSFNSSINAATECYPIMPAITQGDDDFERIGDKVRGRWLVLKGHIQYNAAYINTIGANNYVPPSTVRVLVLSQRNIRSNAQVQTLADVAHLLKDNVATGTGRAYVGTMTDNLAPINKDLFKVHLDRKVRMKAIYQTTDGTGTGSWVGLPTHYFTCRIKLPATLYFDDTNGGNPNNFAPFFCLGSVLDDGSSPYSVQTPYRVTWLSTAYFEDA